MISFHDFICKIILYTWGSKPANVAYASPCGITVRPTVMPAITSLRNFSELYFGNHAKIGTCLDTNLRSRSTQVFFFQRSASVAILDHDSFMCKTINKYSI